MCEEATNRSELDSEKREVTEGPLGAVPRLPYVAPRIIEVGMVPSLTFGITGPSSDSGVPAEI